MLHASRRRDIEEAALGRAGGEVGIMRICNGSGVGGRVLLAEREGISMNIVIRIHILYFNPSTTYDLWRL